MQTQAVRSHTEANSVTFELSGKPSLARSCAYNPEFLCNPEPRVTDVMVPSRRNAAACRLFRNLSNRISSGNSAEIHDAAVKGLRI